GTTQAAPPISASVFLPLMAPKARCATNSAAKSRARKCATTAPLRVAADGSAVAEFTSRVDQRGDYYYKNLDFTITWDKKDGTTGKSASFSVEIPTRECEPGDFKELEIL
ncbi:hypothetical protein K2X33_10970, partial [bacterium]|nr:hypothetical protein [bacterium]